MVFMAHGDTSYDDLGSGSSVPRKMTVTDDFRMISTSMELWAGGENKLNAENRQCKQLELVSNDV